MTAGPRQHAVLRCRDSTTVALAVHEDIRSTGPNGLFLGNIDGMFVGKVIDGPLGIIGGWGTSGA